MSPHIVDGTGLIRPDSGEILVFTEANKLLNPSDSELHGEVVESLKEAGLSKHIGRLDLNFTDLNEDERAEVLHRRYCLKLVEDGLRTGHFILDESGEELRVSIQQPLPTVAGYVFEAFVVRRCNNKKESIGKNIFKWITEREKLQERLFEKFHAIGVGFRETNNRYPGLYNPSHPRFDVMFVTKENGDPEPACVVYTSRRAGLQVKAIRNKEYEYIIKPIMKGKYKHVLTLLKHSNGMHSYEACMREVDKRISDRDRRNKIKEKIRHPRQLGISQRYIDEYYEYIERWYRGQAEADNTILQGTGLSVRSQIYSGNSASTSFST